MRRNRVLTIVRRLTEFVLIGAAFFLLLWTVPSVFTRFTAGTREQLCIANLRSIYQAMQMYRADHDGAYPWVLVSTAPAHRPTHSVPALAPSYLKETESLICPDDPNAGKKGWSLPCSYEYQLQELLFPETRDRVQTELINEYGSDLRLLLCASQHRPWRGFITLRADGAIRKERFRGQDQQKNVRRAIFFQRGGKPIVSQHQKE